LDWNEIVEQYIVKHSNKIQAVTRPLHDHFGISYFTYHRIDEAGKYTVLIDRPEWAECYVGKEFYKQDPFLTHPDNFQPGESYVEALGQQNLFTEVIESAKSVLDIDIQIQIIEKQNGAVEFFGFGGNSQNRNFQQIYLNHIPLLKTFSHHFTAEFASILLDMHEEAAPLHLLKGDHYFESHPLHGLINVQAFLQDLGLQEQVKKAALLSPREKECLKYLLNGQSAKETARALGLSSRTIETYFEKIKLKFGCWSKNEIFTIAQQLSSLRLLP